jgi:hypothetical protein
MKALQSEVGELWFGGNGPEAQQYVAMCLAGEGGELMDVILHADVSPDFLRMILSAAISAEIGKLCNNVKKMHRAPAYRENTIAAIRSELPDIKFYMAKLEQLLAIDPDEDWHRKMNHNERKYDRIRKARPFRCGCGACIAKCRSTQSCVICDRPTGNIGLDMPPWCEECIRDADTKAGGVPAS